MDFQDHQDSFLTYPMRLRQRHRSIEGYMLLNGNRKKNQSPIFDQFKTFLTKDPLESYEIFSNIASKYTDTQIFKLIIETRSLNKRALQNINLILQDFNYEKQKYQDDKRLANFLLFTNQLVSFGTKRLLYLENDDFSNSEDQPKHTKFVLFMIYLLKITKSLEVVQAIIKCCYRCCILQQIKNVQNLKNLFKSFRYGSDHSLSQLDNLKKIIAEMNEEDLLIFQLDIEKNFNYENKQFVKKLTQKLKEKAYSKLFQKLLQIIEKNQVIKFVRQFTSFTISKPTPNSGILQQPKYLHKDLLTQENLSFIIQDLIDIFLSNLPQLLGQSVDDTILCSISQNILTKILKSTKSITKLDYQTILKFSKLLELLISNSKKELKIAQISKEAETVKGAARSKYLCNIFQIFAQQLKNIKTGNEVVQMLPIKIYEDFLSEIQVIMLNQQHKHTVEESFIGDLIELQIFFTQLQAPSQYSEYSGLCVVKIMQILSLYQGKLQSKKTTQSYFRLLNYWASKSMGLEDENSELKRLVQNFLNRYYQSETFDLKRRIIPLQRNTKTNLVLKTYAEQELKILLKQKTEGSLQKLAGEQLLKKQEQIANRIKKILPLMNLKDQENPQKKNQMAPTVLAYFYQELPNYQLAGLHKIRNWICQFEAREQSRPKKFIQEFQTVEKTMQILLPTIKQWNYKAWCSPVQSYENKQTVTTFKILINHYNKMIRILHLKKAKDEYEQKCFSGLVKLIFDLKCILHQAQHKCYDYLRVLSKEQLQNQDKRIPTENYCCFYSELFTIQKKLGDAVTHLIVCFKRTLSTKNQRCLFKSVGKLIKMIKGNQVNQNDYYNKNINIVRAGLISTMIKKFLLQRSSINRFPCEQIYSVPRNQELDQREEGHMRQFSLNIAIFSCIYSEIQDSFLQILRQIISAKKTFFNTKKKQLDLVVQGKNPPRIYIQISRAGSFVGTIIAYEKSQNQSWRIKNQSQRILKLSSYQLFNTFASQLQTSMLAILVPSLKISGACQFNGTYHQKATDEMGFGILYHQLHSILNSNDIDFLFDIKINSLLRNYQNKITRQQNNLQQYQRRQQLFENSVPVQEIDIVLNLCQGYTVDQMIAWIFENRKIIDEALCAQATAQSMIPQEIQKMTLLKNNQFKQNINLELIKLSSTLIQKIKEQNKNQKLYKVLFVLLKHLNQQEVKNFKTMITKELFSVIKQVLNQGKQQTIKQVVKACDILNEQFFTHSPVIVSSFYQEGIGYHILNILNFISSQEWKDKTKPIETLLEIILNYLPNVEAQSFSKYEKEFTNYVFSICQMLQNNNFKANQISSLLLLFSNIKKCPLILDRAKQTYIKLLNQKRLDSEILSIYSNLNNDEEYIRASIEHTIKMFVKQCQPKSENGNHKFTVKEISKYLARYQRNSCFKQVCHKYLRILDNDTLFFSEQQHSIDLCETLKIKFINYEPSNLQKLVINYFMAQISNGQTKQESSAFSPFQLLSDLLQAQKLLIPYFLTRRIKKSFLKGKEFKEDTEITFDPISWLIFRSCKNKTKQCFKLLGLLLLNNGFWIDSNTSISDYTCAVLISNLPVFRPQASSYSEYFQQEAQKWTMLFIYNFMKIKNFFKYFTFDKKRNLLEYTKQKLTQVKVDLQGQQRQVDSPVICILAEKILGVYFQNKLINELTRRKLYKISRSQNQIDKQYIDADLIVKRNQRSSMIHHQYDYQDYQRMHRDRQRRQSYDIVTRNNNDLTEERRYARSAIHRRVQKPLNTLFQPLQGAIGELNQMMQEKDDLESIIRQIESLLPKSEDSYNQKIQKMSQKEKKFEIIQFQVDKNSHKLLKDDIKKMKSYKKGLRSNYFSEKIKHFDQSVKNIVEVLESNNNQSQIARHRRILENMEQDEFQQFIHRRHGLTRNQSINQSNQQTWTSVISQMPRMDRKIQIRRQRQQKKQKKRQILWNLGLSQKFLSQNDIDQKQFDELDPDQQMQLLLQVCYSQLSQEEKQQMKNSPISLRVFPTQNRPTQIQKERPRRQYEITDQPIQIAKHPEIPLICFSKINMQICNQMLNSLYFESDQNERIGFSHLLKNKAIQKYAIQVLIVELRKLKQEQKEIKQIVKQIKRPNPESRQTVLTWKLQKISKQTIIKRILSLLENVDIKHGMKVWDYLYEKVQSSHDMSDNLNIGTQKNVFTPALQLIDIALEYSPDVAVKLISRVQNVPKIFKEKLIGLFRNEVGRQIQSFKDLDNLSNDQQMKQLFEETFPENNPPDLELYGKIITYQFAKVPYLQKLHEKALNDFKPEYCEFLNKVLAQYSEADFHRLQPLFEKHIEKYKQVLSTLQKLGRNIKNQPISRLNIQTNFSFREKEKLFRSNPQVELSHSLINLQIKRSQVFQSSFEQIMKLDPQKLKGRLNITFIDQIGLQPSIDAGGPTSEWFTLISKAFVDKKYKLFRPTQTQQFYTPDPLCFQNSKALKMYIFIGRVFGLALRHKEIISQSFTQAFYKYFLNIPVQYADLEQQDEKLYKDMEQWKNLDVTDWGLNFSYTVGQSIENKNNLGKKRYFERQLVPGGKNIPLTEENKLDFITKRAIIQMKGDMYLQMRHVIIGINELVPLQLLSNFSVNDFQLLLSGVPKYTSEDLKKRVKYQGYTQDDQIVKWVWEILGQYSQEQLCHFVQFITGKAYLSVNQQKYITFMRYPNSDKILTAHTCPKILDLYEYDSKEKLRQKMRIVQYGYVGFSFG